MTTIIAVIAFSGALIAVIPSGEVLQKLVISVLAFLAITMQQQRSLSRQSLWLIWPFVAYFVIAMLSAFSHSRSVIYILAAIQPLLVGLILYVWATNRPLWVANLRSLRRLTYAVVLAQCLFVLIKLIIHGIDEKVLIGSMSHTAGQLGFLFPAIAVPLLVFMRGRRNAFTTYALVGAMFLFGIINEKRSVVFLLPLIVLASIAVNNAASSYRIPRMLGNFLVGGVIAISGAALGIFAVPSLNPESAYGGDVSFSYAVQYAIDYLTMDYGGSLQGSYADAASDSGIQVGRVVLWMSIVDWLKSVDTWTLLFGVGFGTATPSIWLQEGSDHLFGIIGTRGGISGAGLAAVETGLVGLAALGYGFIHILGEVVTAHRQVKSFAARHWFGTVMIIHIVFCFDFFFYSTVLLRTFPMPLIFFGVIASIPLVKRWDDALLSRETEPLGSRGAAVSLASRGGIGER